MFFFDHVLQFENTGFSRHINAADIRDASEVMINEEVRKFLAVDHDHKQCPEKGEMCVREKKGGGKGGNGLRFRSSFLVLL